MLRAWALLLLLAPLGSAQIILETSGTASREVVVAPVDLAFDVPFHVAQNGTWSAKILPLADNPVYDGQANGTIGPDGTTGWHVTMFLRAADGSPAVDRDGVTVPDLGRFVNGSRTPTVAVEGDVTYRLSIIVHVPAEGQGTSGRIPIAMLFTAGGSTAGNGGGLESSKAFTIWVNGVPPVRTETGTGAEGSPTQPAPARGLFGDLANAGAAGWLPIGFIAIGAIAIILLLWWLTRPLRQIRDRLTELVDIESQRLALEASRSRQHRERRE